MSTYLMDGKEAQGEDYADAIERLRTDDLDFIRIKTEKDTLLISSDPDGMVLTDEKSDGSSWISSPISKIQVKDLLRDFVNEKEHWREALDWELLTVSTKDGAFRTLRIILIGIVIIASALALVRLLVK